MVIEKVEVVDRIEVTENGCVQVRTRKSIVEDGVQISGTFHRHIVAPGDDYSNENPRVKAICATTQTNEVIKSYKAAVAAQGV